MPATVHRHPRVAGRRERAAPNGCLSLPTCGLVATLHQGPEGRRAFEGLDSEAVCRAKPLRPSTCPLESSKRDHLGSHCALTGVALAVDSTLSTHDRRASDTRQSRVHLTPAAASVGIRLLRETSTILTRISTQSGPSGGCRRARTTRACAGTARRWRRPRGQAYPIDIM